jgi:hypothetical protein
MGRRTRTRRFIAAQSLVWALLVTAGRAQQPDTSKAARQQIQEQIGNQMEMMGPMMGRMAEATLAGTLNVLNKPSTAEQLATFTRNYYDALVKKGFTKDDALRIVMSVGIPMTSGGR